MSRAKLLLPFTCNFHYSLRTVVNFVTAIIHIPHCTAQMMDSERAGVFTGRCFNVFTSIHNDCVWLYSTLLRRQRNEIEFVCLHCCRVLAVSGWEQGLVAASWVSPRNVMLSSPSFLTCALLQVRVPSFVYITGACALWSERQYCD